MGIINSNLSACGLVEKYVGTAYDTVQNVSSNMPSLLELAGAVEDGTFQEIIALGDDITIAAALINYKGIWDSATQYKLGDSVTHDNLLWMSNVDNINSEPTDVNSNWVTIAGVNIGSVDTVEDLPDATSVLDTVITKGTLSPNDGAGGIWHWDINADKSTANMGVIFDPLKAANITDQGTGIGTGCWIRSYDGATNLKWFGAIANDPACDCTPILHFAAGEVKTVMVDDTFYLNSGQTTHYIRKSIHILGILGRAKFITGAGANNYFILDKEAATVMTGSVLAQSHIITVESAANFSVGQMIIISSDQIGESQWNTTKRDFGFIIGIEGNEVKLGFDLNFDYDDATSTTTVDVYNKHGFSFSNIHMENNDSGGIFAHYFSNVLYQNIYQHGISLNTGWGMVPQWCCNVTMSNIHSERMLYPVIVNCSRYIEVVNIIGVSCHHALDAAAFTSDMQCRNINGTDCEGTIGFHPSFNVHVNGLIMDNERSGFGFRTWGGSLSNVRHRFSDDVTTLPNYYLQSLKVANQSIDPYVYCPVAYHKFVSTPNVHGLNIGLQAAADQDCSVSDSDCLKFSAENTGGKGDVLITNSKFETLSARGDSLNISNCRFEGKGNYDHAIRTVHLGEGTGIYLQVSNCSFENFAHVIEDSYNVYAMAVFTGCDFRNITESLIQPHHIDNLNYHWIMTSCGFTDVALFSEHTDQFLGYTFLNCFEYGITPTLPDVTTTFLTANGTPKTMTVTKGLITKSEI